MKKEKWQVQIKGAKKEQVAAAMLATMYDASLDAFRKHDWALPNLYPVFYGNENWTGQDNFVVTPAYGWYPQQPPIEDSAIIYDQLAYTGIVTGPVSFKQAMPGAARNSSIRIRGLRPFHPLQRQRHK